MPTRYVDISEFEGLTFDSIEITKDDEEVIFKGERTFRMYHYQDCCEHVYLEDVVGDLNDLVGYQILFAEEVVNQYDETDKFTVDGKPRDPASETWTFYKLASEKGYVTLRWYGSSNGYYSESVIIEEST